MAPKAAAPKSNRKTNQRGVKKGSKQVSANTKAGTIFPVGRCNTMIRRGRYADRVGKSAGAFMAAILEYITAEMLELAGNVCEERGRKTIAPVHINLGVRHDEELAKLMSFTTISQGGQPPNINAAILTHGKKGKKAAASESQAM